MTADRSGLPEELRAWVEATAGARLLEATPHLDGASRSAWRIDVGDTTGPGALFLLRDKGRGGGSARDAAVLRALANTPVPVPTVVGVSDELAALLLERLPGRGDFPAMDDDGEREPTARHLMELTAALHRLDVEQLDLPHLALPRTPDDCARPALEQGRQALRALGAGADPFFGFALDWLEANVPQQVPRHALVHSDMGPGNFLYEGGRVTGIVDWEVAHFGDPMEDLAAIAVRDMATPVGALPKRFAEYAAGGGQPVELRRVHYYRALVLTRNSLMIGLGLAHPAPGFDVQRMTMYQTLLVRAATLVLCDNLGLERPSAADALPADLPRGGRDERHALEARDRREIAELAGGDVPADEDDARARLCEALPPGAEASPARDDACRYLARRWHRIAHHRRALLGPLYERLPQHLEEERP